MKDCIFCNRTVIGKRYLGMCPKCFANLINILILVISVILLPIATNIVAIALVIPFLSGLISAGIGWLITLVIIFIFFLAFLIYLGWIVFWIVKLVARNKKI